MRQFALKHLSSFMDIVKDLNAGGASPEEVIDRMIHVNIVDPRNALQIVNAFAQSGLLREPPLSFLLRNTLRLDRL
ncbi:hypothetical protein [Pseudomonas orientalis]|uniref:hypothetical protein n=1 Tax=Pseudomonas orientalis TaxID=76758 RepID=UPI00081265E3|nr:hypothetical protein [Pseudomonas sp. 34 E 7]